MSDQVPAQEQSAPTPTPSESALQVSALQDQLATAKMTNQGAEAVSALEAQLVALVTQKAPETPAVEAVVPKEQQTETATPAPEILAEKSPEEPAAEAEAAKEAKAAETPEPADRIRMGKEYTDADKALVNAAHMLVKAGRAKDFTEAFARVSGLVTPAAPEQPTPEPPPIPPEITALETEIADLEAKMDAAGDGEGLINREYTDLNKQLSRANAKLEAARVRHDNAAETQAVVSDASFEQQRSDVLKATAKDYPQMTDKTSEQWKLARKLAKAASDPSDEDYAKAISLEAPRFFADQAAKLLGIKPASTPAAPSTPQPTSTASSPQSQPPKPGPAPGSRTTAPTPTITKEQILASADQIVADVLAGKGGPKQAPPRNYVMLGR